MSHKQLGILLVVVFAAYQLVAQESITHPTIYINETIRAIEGKDVNLKCSSNFVEKTGAAWLKLVNNEWKNVYYISEMNKKIIYNLYEYNNFIILGIKKLECENAGIYMCQFNTIFGDQNYTVSLDVIKRTQAFMKGATLVLESVSAGERVVFECKVTVDPSLTYKIEWKLNNTKIDFASKLNLINETDNRIIIKKASRNDNGDYTCIVSTNYEGMDDSIATKKLSVLDVPNPPSIRVKCTPSDAIITWHTMDQYGIEKYTIEYETSAEPNIWKTLAQRKAGMSKKLPFTMILRWTDYRFRVIAHNVIGSSIPSEPTEICRSGQDSPYENPRGVTGEGTTPTNMIISWIPISLCRQNGSGFYYNVCWRQCSTDGWNCKNITNSTERSTTIEGLSTFTRYEIKVKSGNSIGEYYKDDIYIGYSGESEPIQAPANFKLINITDFDTVTLSWDPVPFESVNGNISAYVIRIWNKVKRQRNILEKFNDTTFEATIPKLLRGTMHYAQILVKNRAYDGPGSEILEFMTPLPDPSSVQSIDAYPLGSTGFLLKWTKPLELNGQLSGYNIFYEDNNGTKIERNPRTDNPKATQVKLNALQPNTIYRVHIVPILNDTDGIDYWIEAKTNAISEIPTKPNQPTFSWKILSSNENPMRVKINWIPDLTENSGSHFFVQYRMRGIRAWNKTQHIDTDDYVIVDGLLRSERYEFKTISVEGDLMAESEVQDVFIEQSTSPSTDKIVIIVVSTMFLCLAIVLLLIRLCYRIKSKKKLVEERRHNFYNSFKTMEGDFYNVNPNKSNLVPNLYTLSQMPPTSEVMYNNDASNLNNVESTKQVNYAVKHFVNGNLGNINPEMSLDEQADMLPYDQKYEFPREKLDLGKQLGTGAFGIVFQANAFGIVPGKEETTVAVKTLKRMADNEEFRALVLELKIMIYMGRHLNIVNLLGAVTINIAERELMIIVEHCEFGNVQSFLVKHRQHYVDQIIAGEDRIDSSIKCRKVQATSGYQLHTQAPSSGRSVTTTDLLCWSFQIARGMHYLAARKVLHGDLAARNILLCANNVVKICDFGLARSMYKTGNYRIKTERLLPYKWLAIESIGDHVFSTYSDVWSYGIVLWELFSLGAVPYLGMIAGAPLFKMLKEGYRMECPDFATQYLYEIMLSCWNETPESRPLFDQLVEEFSNMLDQNMSEHYISLNEPYSKENETRLSSGQTDYLKLIRSPQNNLPDETSNRATIDDTTYYSQHEMHTNSQLSTMDNSIQIHQSTNC